MKTMSRTPRLSLVMIVKNEERYLPDCLSSVQGIVDEIVMVDTGSTDRTMEIGRARGAKVYEFPWIDDFAAARNSALEHATGNWVLYLDADERLAPGQHGELRSLLSDTRAGAYLVTVGGGIRLSTGRFAHSNGYPRLFRRHPAIRFEGEVHEQITPSILRLRLPVLPSRLMIHHLGYDQSVEVTRSKCHRNIALSRKQLLRNPDDAYARFQLGNALTILKEFGEGRKELEHALQSKTLPAGIRANICNLLAEIDVNEHRVDEALRQYQESLRHAPRQNMARWFMSGVLLNENRCAEALPQLQELEWSHNVVVPAGSDIAYDLTIETADLHFRIGYCHECLGHGSEAVRSYLEVLRARPGFPECTGRLPHVIQTLPDDEILRLLESTTAEIPHSLLALHLAQRYQSASRPADAMRILDNALLRDPEDADLYEAYMTISLASGEHLAAARVWSAVLKRNIHSFELDRHGLQIALQQHDIGSARRYLDRMIGNVPDHLATITPQLIALRAKLAGSPASQSPHL